MISVIVRPDSSTSAEPVFTLSTDSLIRVLISRAALALRCEIANLRCDDREAASLFARSSGLNGGVQREQIRLECDFVDDSDDVPILRLDSLISFIAVTARLTTAPPLSA